MGNGIYVHLERIREGWVDPVPVGIWGAPSSATPTHCGHRAVCTATRERFWLLLSSLPPHHQVWFYTVFEWTQRWEDKLHSLTPYQQIHPEPCSHPLVCVPRLGHHFLIGAVWPRTPFSLRIKCELLLMAYLSHIIWPTSTSLTSSLSHFPHSPPAPLASLLLLKEAEMILPQGFAFTLSSAWNASLQPFTWIVLPLSLSFLSMRPSMITLNNTPPLLLSTAITMTNFLYSKCSQICYAFICCLFVCPSKNCKFNKSRGFVSITSA